MKSLALVLVAVAGFLTPASSAAAATTYDSEVLRYTNLQRSHHGLPPLKLSFCLRDRFAAPWARHLAATRTLAHQSLRPMLTTCHGTAAGENVAYGNVTPARMVEMWMASPGHRANILNRSYNYLGVGAVRGADRRVYGVQDFLRQ